MLDDLCGKWEITPSAKSFEELKAVLDRDGELARETERQPCGLCESEERGGGKKRL